MKVCPNCKTQMEDGIRFCANCGTEVPNVAFCSQCGAQNALDVAFCANCGNPMNQAAAPAQNKAAEAANAAADMAKNVMGKATELVKKIPQKMLMIGGAAVAALIVLIVVISIIAGGKAHSDYALYIKDSELFTAKMPSGKAWQVTSDLESNSTTVRLTKDGKTIFYIDEYEDGGVLYYRSITSSKSKVKEVDSDVDSFQINESGKLVTYKKNGNLYQHNLKEKKKISSDVGMFTVSKDGKKIIFEDTEGDLFYWNGKEKSKIASDIGSLYYVSENFKTVYFSADEGNLYKWTKGKDKEKIASDVDGVEVVYENGDMYYLKETEEQIKYIDFVKGVDKESWEYEWLNENTLSTSELYFYNGSKSTMISEYTTDGNSAADEAVVVYGAIDPENLETVSAKDYEEDSSKMWDAIEDSIQMMVAVGTKTSKIEVEDASSMRISSDGKAIYYIANVDDGSDDEDEDAEPKEPTGELFKIAISGKKPGKPKQVDSDVYANTLRVYNSKMVVYFKDYNAEKNCAELFVNGKSADQDVNLDQMQYVKDTKTLLYFVDFDSEYDKQCGTLKAFKGSKAKKVMDDVYSWTVMPEGEVLFLQDYDTEKREGNLCIYKGGKPKQIDDEVTRIINVNSWDD